MSNMNDLPPTALSYTTSVTLPLKLILGMFAIAEPKDMREYVQGVWVMNSHGALCVAATNGHVAGHVKIPSRIMDLVVPDSQDAPHNLDLEGDDSMSIHTREVIRSATWQDRLGFMIPVGALPSLKLWAKENGKAMHPSVRIEVEWRLRPELAARNPWRFTTPTHKVRLTSGGGSWESEYDSALKVPDFQTVMRLGRGETEHTHTVGFNQVEFLFNPRILNRFDAFMKALATPRNKGEQSLVAAPYFGSLEKQTTALYGVDIESSFLYRALGIDATFYGVAMGVYKDAYGASMQRLALPHFRKE